MQRFAPQEATAATHRADFYRVYGFGRNDWRQLAMGDTKNRYKPERIMINDSSGVVDVACGIGNSVFLCANNQAYACGRNHRAQCAIGTTTLVVADLEVASELSDLEVTRLYSGYASTHLMAVNATGDLYTVGHNDRGQLAHGTTNADIVEKSRRVELEGERVATAASNREHSAIVTETGALYVCGGNDSGQLGTDDMASKPRFHLVKGLSSRPVLAVACGYKHTVVSLKGGGVMAFGNNEHGQLGIGRVTGPILEPTSCGANVIVVQLACGDIHTAALTAGGDVYTFGSNKCGQLGLGRADESDVTKPTRVRISAKLPVKITQIACGCDHTLMVTDGGELYITGDNSWGQLGLGKGQVGLGARKDGINSPKLVSALSDQVVVKVAAGRGHSMCLTRPRLVLISVPNVAALLESAHSRDIPDLKERCLAFILDNYTATGATEGFNNLPQELMQEVLARYSMGQLGL